MLSATLVLQRGWQLLPPHKSVLSLRLYTQTAPPEGNPWKSEGVLVLGHPHRQDSHCKAFPQSRVWQSDLSPWRVHAHPMSCSGREVTLSDNLAYQVLICFPFPRKVSASLEQKISIFYNFCLPDTYKSARHIVSLNKNKNMN